MRAFHWYSLTPLTTRLSLVAVTLLVVQDPPVTGERVPHFSAPVAADRSVAQLTVADEPTTSVRYG
jgi:hypothetical protein